MSGVVIAGRGGAAGPRPRGLDENHQGAVETRLHSRRRRRRPAAAAVS